MVKFGEKAFRMKVQHFFLQLKNKCEDSALKYNDLNLD